MSEQQKRERGSELMGLGLLSDWGLGLWAVLYGQGGNSSGPSFYRYPGHPWVT